MPTTTVWVAGDAHVGTDKKHGRESLADAIRQSEGQVDGAPAIPWDIMLDVGDLSGDQGTPTDEEGEEVIRQYAALREHTRSQIYNVCGNHDATGPDDPEPQWWFQKWVDPLGQSTAHSGVDAAARPFPVSGEWDRYAFDMGNVRFLMMSDRNDGGPPVGRGAHGGYPAGAVTRETFDWWVDQVESHRDRIIVSLHHHMLKETTVGSGPWEGYLMDERDAYGKPQQKYHGYFPDGGPMGAGYLYWVDGNPDAQAFERYLAAQPGAVDLWLGGHTHTHPDDTSHGRSHIERKWDVNFVNCASMTRFHGVHYSVPKSRVLEFTPGSAELRVRCYMHTDEFLPLGYYAAAERTIPLRHPYEPPSAG